ncbi:MAG: cytochrome c3 family protein [Pyrinomonadaceae bacterium]
MKNLAKLIVILVFALGAMLTLLTKVDPSRAGSSVLAQAAATPTPPANSPANANTNVPAASNTKANMAANTNANAAKPPAPAAGDKKMRKSFVLGKDSFSEYGEVPFDHETHAFKPYSPDGKSVVGCVECHHTDQPKSALKPPLITSERDVILTFETWKASDQKVNECRFCHFQDGLVPDGKTMPTADYTDGGRTTTKDLNNELAYHINCNTCHDAAFKLRPELKSRKGFATSKDCLVCHTQN